MIFFLFFFLLENVCIVTDNLFPFFGFQPKLMSGKIQRKVMKEWSKRDAPEVAKGFVRSRL